MVYNPNYQEKISEEQKEYSPNIDIKKEEHTE